MSFKPTLAVAADFAKIKYPVFASPKLDGIRCSIVGGKALSRTLKPIPNHHTRSLLEYLCGEGMDGELIVGSPTSKTVYTDTVSQVMSHDKTPDFTFFVFDMHSAAGGFAERHKSLADLVAVNRRPAIVKMLGQVLVKDEPELLAYESRCVDIGYEGIILRNPDAPYKFGRSTVNEGYLLKVKRFEDSEAMIIGFEEEMFNGNEAGTNELGRTKRSTAKAGLVGKGTLGAFMVRDIHSGVEFSIGTGLTAEQRAAAWQDRDKLIGSLAKYKFFPVGVKDKPRHPVFLGYRSALDIS